MPVEKFKTFEEAERALWNFKPDVEYFRKVREFYGLFFKLSRFTYPKGIYKFRTFEEAEEHKMKLIVSAALKKITLDFKR